MIELTLKLNTASGNLNLCNRDIQIFKLLLSTYIFSDFVFSEKMVNESILGNSLLVSKTSLLTFQ